MRLLLIVLVCLAVASELALAFLASSSPEWEAFQRKYNKQYHPNEAARRFLANFFPIKDMVERHNANGSASFKMALNHLSDLNPEEFKRMNGLKLDKRLLSRKLSSEDKSFLDHILANNDPLPAKIDWRKVADRVTPVKSQGHCGSCWAFATIGLLEGQQVTRNFSNKLVALSAQELVDCSKSNAGCGGGGLMGLALKDIHKIGGIEAEKDYPYRARDGACKFKKNRSVMTDLGAIVMSDINEEDLKKVVATYGPVAVGIYATDQLQSYSEGVFIDQTCPDDENNHGVLLVGYGTDPQHGDYWIVKNSWSEEWGERGYFRMKRGSAMCGILLTPTIAKF